MAPRSFLFCILCTIGLIPSLITALNVSLGFAREPPRSLVTTKGRSVVIPCEPSSSSSEPARVVSWSLDGVPLILLNSDAAADGATSAQDIRRTLMPDGSLFIKKVLHKSSSGTTPAPSSEGAAVSSQNAVQSDQGVYQCTIANGIGAILSRSSSLRIATLPSQFSESPQDLSVETGDAARFSCRIDAVPQATITWEKDKETLPQDERYQVLPSGVLLIANVQAKDTGNYKCIATSPYFNNKKRQSSDGRLNLIPASKKYRSPLMLGPPTTSTIPPRDVNTSSPTPSVAPNQQQYIPVHHIQILQGEKLSLECAASGYPTPQLVWSFLYPGQTEQTLVASMLYGVNVLHLPEIKTSFSGLYTCKAVNHESEDSQAITAQQVYNVSVLVPPYFIKAPQSQTYPTAKTVRFECELGGFPEPEISWYKNGVLLHINGRIKQRGSSLVLSNTVTDDSGIYQCRGTSVAGEVWEAARLLVNTSRNQPTPPSGIKCLATSSSSITVTWDDSSRSTSKFTAYTVHYLPTAGGEERQEVAINKTYKVEKLQPFTNYTFYVRVYSAESASDQSMRIVCRTGEGIPSLAPKVRLEAAGPTSLRASWNLLKPEEALGEVTEHKIQWRKSGQKSANVDQVKADVLDYTITGLSPGQKYDVRVLSATSQGWPELNDELTARGSELRWFSIEMPGLGPTNSNVPLPPEVHLTVVNATSIEVTWTLPRENKVKPSGFRLSYRRQNDMLVGPIALEGHVHQYLLTGLDGQTQYEVQVQAVGAGDVGGGTGAKSIHTLAEGAEHRTEDALLEPPSGLEAEPSSSNSIRLSWRAPSTAASVSYYTVRYHPVQSALSVNASTLSYVRSTSLSVDVTDLRPFTAYEFQVRSHDVHSNQGPYSNKVECHTMEGAPSPPWSLQWKILNLTTVRVSWKEPQQANGLLGPYRLYYTLEASKPLEQWTQIETILLNTEVTGLLANNLYFLCVKASTSAGLGNATNVVMIKIPAVINPSPGPTIPPTSNQPQSPYENRMWLIFIALGTGLLAILALVALVLTMRYAKSAQLPDSSQCGGPTATRGRRLLHHSNGNGFFRSAPHASAGQTTSVEQGHTEEMEFFAPILFTGSSTNIPPAETSTTHLDTKGGYPVHLNGTRAPLLGNGRVPNGHVTKPYHTRPDTQLRITENPQFNSHSSRCTACSSSGIDSHGSTCTACLASISSGEEPLLLNSSINNSNNHHHHNHHHHLQNHNNEDENEEDEENDSIDDNERWRNDTQLTNLQTDDSNCYLEEIDLERRTTNHIHKNGQPPCA